MSQRTFARRKASESVVWELIGYAFPICYVFFHSFGCSLSLISTNLLEEHQVLDALGQ